MLGGARGHTRACFSVYLDVPIYICVHARGADGMEWLGTSHVVFMPVP
jgi:hypothetical protein